MLKWHHINQVYDRGLFATLHLSNAKIFEIHWVPSLGRHVLTNFLPSATIGTKAIKIHFETVTEAKEMADDILIRWMNQNGMQFKPQGVNDGNVQ